MKSIAFTFLALSLLNLTSVYTIYAQNNWNQFRGETGQGLSSASNVPTKWDTENNVAWKTEIPGNGWSSPVVVDNYIYLTSAVELDNKDSISLRTICINQEDGNIKWNVEVFKPTPEKVGQIHSKNSLASPTPIVKDGKLYVHFGHMGTAAPDLEGHIIWKQNGIDYPPVHGNGGSPAIVNDLLVFSCDGMSNPFVIALDIHTGDIAWKTPRNTHAKKNFSFCTPLIINADGQQQIILPGSGFVGSYNPKDGKELWRVKYGEGYSVIPRPVYAHGMLYVSSCFNSPQAYAINPIGAEGDATDSHIVWQQRRGAPNTPSMIVVGDELYMVSDGGVASCLDVKTGKAHWSERLGGNFSASPVSVEGNIYFLNETGSMFIVKADKEYKRIATNDINERTLASPAILDNSILIRSASHLWKIKNES